jgi:hypothetical protein
MVLQRRTGKRLDMREVELSPAAASIVVHATAFMVIARCRRKS